MDTRVPWDIRGHLTCRTDICISAPAHSPCLVTVVATPHSEVDPTVSTLVQNMMILLTARRILMNLMAHLMTIMAVAIQWEDVALVPPATSPPLTPRSLLLLHPVTMIPTAVVQPMIARKAMRSVRRSVTGTSWSLATMQE
uniref:Uncharacterized protein n=1 Tax=Cacopsylla melanoneura TaxID=428564 RepID=A0A8D8TGD6_9HEMI